MPTIVKTLDVNCFDMDQSRSKNWYFIAELRLVARCRETGGKQDPRSRWLASLRQRRHANVAAVALANKNARIVWAMLAGNVSYEPGRTVQAA